jgi:catechol 2,3-dioxygenase-like lactoylglutathione lyase family enzyme
MKRLHVNVKVEAIDASVRFYRTLFAAEPVVLESDYARWMLDDPLLNFAISTRGARSGIDHLGIQVEDAVELAEVYGRLQQAGGPTLDEGETTCCYARSTKQWIADPQGITWETFLTHGPSTVYGHEREDAPVVAVCCTGGSACC